MRSLVSQKVACVKGKNFHVQGLTGRLINLNQVDFPFMGAEFEEDGSRAYRIKGFLDRMLPLVILLLGVYLYLEFLAASSALTSYTFIIQYLLLAYFIVELLVLFSMYEDNRKFFRNHWFDILLTVPFVTAFKGLKGIKVFKSAKAVKPLKSGKILKGTKFFQKAGKMLKKTRKQVKKFL